MTGVQRAVALAFGLLVAATFAAFFVAQNLKSGPSILQQVGVYPVVSPNGDGRKDGARISFKTRETDDVRIDVLDDAGDEVATIFEDRIGRYTPTQVRWDAKVDGEPVPDGRYRYRVTLRTQGRSVVVPKSFVVDTEPPSPRVVGIGPVQSTRPQPELLPNPDGHPARVVFDAPGTNVKIRLFKTGPGPVRPVMEAVDLPEGATSWAWDGTVGGRRVSPGTYLVVVESRDIAGNVGTSVPLDRRGLPRAEFASGFPGRGGITVRYLGVQPPVEPTRAGERGVFGVDARQERYTWNLRKVGEPEVRKRGSGTRAQLGIAAPEGEGGVFLLEVRTRTRSVRVPWVVRPQTPIIGTTSDRRGVLVVLAMGTWQGLNPVDDDGDGLADTLERGLPVRLQRVLVGDGTGLPIGFAEREAPLLAHLARTGRRFDVTTDVALAAGRGPRPADGYRGVVLPGDTRWLAPTAARRLRSFVRDGGVLATFGVDSLRREVRLTPRLRLIEPTAPAEADLFGARAAPLSRGPVTLTEIVDGLDLFDGTPGAFEAGERFEVTTGIGPDARRLSAAVTPAGRPVILGTRFGSRGGRLLRIGLPTLPSRLSSDPDLAQLVRNAWILLSR